MPDPTAIDTDYNLVREERLQAMLDGEFQRGVEGLDADPSAPPEFIIAHAKGSIVGENNARKIQGLPPLSDDEIDVRLSHAARAILPAQQHEDPGVPTGTSVLIDAARGAKRWGSVAAGIQEPSGIAEDVVAAPVGIAKGAMHVYDKAIDEPLTAATTSVLGEHGRDVSTALQLFGPGAVGPGLSNAVKGTLQLGKAKAPEALEIGRAHV